MKVVETIADMQKLGKELQGTVGLVPTMGYLHEGHLTLVRRAKQENRYAVVSIFVNPTQFGPREDFDRYPRDYPRDLAMLRTVDTDIVIMPPVAEMYPPGFNVWVEVKGVTERLEGELRPGHFRGVATVVNKLFNIVAPTRGYFGQKDAQQCVVIKKMVADLNMNVEVVIVPTVREPDGLAMSSRNIYLSAEERRQAAVLYQSLLLAQKLWLQGERDAGRIRREMTALIQGKPLANIEYISIAHADTLEELAKAEPPALISMVVRFGKTRLLDNVVLG